MTAQIERAKKLLDEANNDLPRIKQQMAPINQLKEQIKTSTTKLLDDIKYIKSPYRGDHVLDKDPKTGKYVKEWGPELAKIISETVELHEDKKWAPLNVGVSWSQADFANGVGPKLSQH